MTFASLTAHANSAVGWDYVLDTNVILEAYRSGSWPALAGGYDVETVEACVTETRTGFQRRRPERQIDVAGLRESLAAVHGVAPLDRARLAVRAGNILLDEGESGALGARIEPG